MTDHTQPQDPFEATLARLMTAASDRALRPFDAAAIARDVAGRAPASNTVRRRAHWPRRPLLVLAFLALGGATATGILLSGDHRTDEPPPSVPPSPAVAVVEPSEPAAASTTPSPTPSAEPDASEQAPSDAGGPPVIGSCLAAVAQGASGVPNPGWDVSAASTTKHPTNGLIAGVTGIRTDGSAGPNAGVLLLDPQSGETTRVADVAPGVSGGVSWSPAGNALAITSGAGSGLGGLCGAVDVLTGDRLSRVGATRGQSSFLWAPDGASMLLSSGTVIHADGSSGPTLPACGDSCSYDSMLWSPDGQRIVVRRLPNDGAASTAVISVATGEVTEIPLPAGTDQVDVVAWLDADTLLAQSWSRSGRLRWVELGLDGSTSTSDVDLDAFSASTLTTSPDFSAAAGQSCLRCPFVSTVAGTTRTIWSGPSPTSQVWSPDSRWIAFSVRGSGSTSGTWVVRRDGSGLRRVSTKVLAQMDWGRAGS